MSGSPPLTRRLSSSISFSYSSSFAVSSNTRLLSFSSSFCLWRYLVVVASTPSPPASDATTWRGTGAAKRPWLPFPVARDPSRLPAASPYWRSSGSVERCTVQPPPSAQSGGGHPPVQIILSHSPPGAPYAVKNHLFIRCIPYLQSEQTVRISPVVRLPAPSAQPTAHAVLLFFLSP